MRNLKAKDKMKITNYRWFYISQIRQKLKLIYLRLGMYLEIHNIPSFVEKIK